MKKKISNEIAFGKETLVLKVPGELSDKYTIEKEIGSGGYGKVYRVKNKTTGEYRACKKLPKLSIKDLEDYIKETNILSKMDHPSIIKIYEILEDNYNYYIIMEECRGGDLLDKIITMNERGEKYTEKHAAIIFKQLMSAISYCHSVGVVHRDLKVDNILLAYENDDSTIKLIDFGSSKINTTKGKFKLMNSLVGTPDYVSPEVILGKYDEKCDIWSAGVILYEMLSGKTPFANDDDSQLYKDIAMINYSFPQSEWKDVSNEARDLIKHMLCKGQERYTAQQVLEHTWVKHCAPNSSQLKNINIETFKKYRNSNKLKRLVLIYIASRLKDSDVEQLRKNFIAMDKNNDGTLSLNELKDAIKKLGKEKEIDIEAVFSSIDTDKSGKIEYTEFLAASLEAKVYLRNDRLVEAFKAFDTDNDGKISKEDFRKVLINDLDVDSFEKYFEELDLKGDGEIDYDEFLIMMQTNK